MMSDAVHAMIAQAFGISYLEGFVVAYSLCLFAFTRVRLYLMHGLFALALLFNTLVSSYLVLTIPFLEEFWDAEGRRLGYLVILSGVALSAAGIALFRDFTVSPSYFPRADAWIRRIPLLIAALLLPLSIPFQDLALNLVNLIALVLVIAMTGLSVAVMRRGHKEAVFQLLTYSFFLAGSILYAIGGFMPLSDKAVLATKYAFFYGSALSLAFLSIGVAKRMNRLQAEREQVKSLFGAYVSKQVLERILEKQESWEGEEREATILFTDIRGYTALTESMPPREIIRLLNEYYAALVDIVNRHQGIVNKFMGDSIMALFNVPVDQDDHARRGLETARAILDYSRKATFGPGIRFETNLGLHTGRIVAGSIGSSSRLEYSVLGDAVNTASRLEQLNKEFRTPMLLSGAIVERIPERSGLRLVAEDVPIRGRKSGLSVWTIDD